MPGRTLVLPLIKLKYLLCLLKKKVAHVLQRRFFLAKLIIMWSLLFSVLQSKDLNPLAKKEEAKT